MISLEQNTAHSEQHFTKVKDLIQRRIRKILTTGIRRNKVRVVLSPDFVTYLTDLENEPSLRHMILAKPDQLTGLITNVKANYVNFCTVGTDENYVLHNIFVSHCYDCSDFSKWDFIQCFQLDTCPYCNRNYTYSLSKASNLKPQIDHFYPKNIYPFLAASYFNLIPCCQTCNGFGAKEEKDPIVEGLINPYLLTYNDFKFRYEIKSLDFIHPLRNKRAIEVKFSNHVPGHTSVFKLDKFYQEHSDHVLELIIKSKVAYSKQYREYLKTSYQGFTFSDSEIDRMIVGNYCEINEVHKRPLAKLYRDISKQLGLI